MAIVWSDSIDGIDWDELAALYLLAPLARKNPTGLCKAFSNSMFHRMRMKVQVAF